MDARTHPPGRYPAHCSLEFGLSSPPILETPPVREPSNMPVRPGKPAGLPEWAGRPSGPAANVNIICAAARPCPMEPQ